VIAVGVDGRVQWANHGMDRLLHHAPRLNAPLIDSVRDPDFLAAIQKAAREQVVTSARSNTIAVGRTFDVTAAPMPAAGRSPCCAISPMPNAWKDAARFYRQCLPRTAHAVDFDPGIHRDVLDSPIADNHVREFWKSYGRTRRGCRGLPKIC